MGTTVTAAYLDGDTVVVAHVGDSRCYLLRDGDLIRLTRDHSLVGELVARGKLTEEQAETHPQRSVITRALGAYPDVEVDTEVFPARDGDVFLLCSDGLTGMVHEPALKPMLEDREPLARADRPRADRRRQRGRRARQHHGDPVPARGRSTTAAAAATPPPRSSREAALTAEYETFEGEAVEPRQGVGAVELRADEVSAGPGDDDAEAEYRRHGTVALQATPQTEEGGAAAPAREPPPSAPRRCRSRPEGRRRRKRSRRNAAADCSPSSCRCSSAPGWRRARSTSSAPTRPPAARVTIYRGLPYELPFGVDLYETYYESGVPLADVAAGAARELHGPPAALARRRRGPGDPAGEGPGRVSARNRELLALVPASLLLTAGFAAIFIQQSAELSDVSLTYGAGFLALCLCGPLRDPRDAAVRRPVPVPARRGARLLRARRDLPDRRDARARAGAVVRRRAHPVRGHDRVPARLPRARALPLHGRRGRAAAAAAPARAGHRPAGQRRLPRRRDRVDLLPAGGVREDRDRHLPRRVPARHARGAACRARAGSPA